MDLPVCASHKHVHKHTHFYRKTYMLKQQGEVKAINVSELAMHHTSALIDRWHQESVPLLVHFLHKNTHARALFLEQKGKRFIFKDKDERSKKVL